MKKYIEKLIRSNEPHKNIVILWRQNPRIVEGKVREYQNLGTISNPRIVKTANTKSANNEGRLYQIIFIPENGVANF